MKTIQTERLCLRPYCYEDLMAVHEYASNEEVVKYMLFGPNTIEDSKGFLQYIIEDLYLQDPLLTYEYAIEFNGTMVGAVSMTLKKEEATGELGWILNPKYHRKGILTEAATALMETLRADLNLERVIAKCDARNVASAKLMEKLGLKLVETKKGVRRSKKSGEYVFDELTYELKFCND